VWSVSNYVWSSLLQPNLLTVNNPVPGWYLLGVLATTSATGRGSDFIVELSTSTTVCLLRAPARARVAGSSPQWASRACVCR
jgi:hypothetical protein